MHVPAITCMAKMIWIWWYNPPKLLCRDSFVLERLKPVLGLVQGCSEVTWVCREDVPVPGWQHQCTRSLQGLQGKQAGSGQSAHSLCKHDSQYTQACITICASMHHNMYKHASHYVQGKDELLLTDNKIVIRFCMSTKFLTDPLKQVVTKADSKSAGSNVDIY